MFVAVIVAVPPPSFIRQMPCECVAAYSMRLQFPPPVHVGTRFEGWISRCVTS